ncbi:LOW QUALITY PROTEIN: protein still life, isoform SIF type 1-like [Portunus trituberculatus]|uniref:LOW QUALITY PROTEIN: protein still life, isoform SIF type 1-like n=1 Tax=Portunus trituberculatus TaxID=210409 RepID=UPI001E1CE92F|nr:LOW QUALITY PROTEIN: protein still life, isoform SIF type 1-like [Portunus trituberculatus]
MGNKLSCSCAPLIKKTGYRYEDSPWNPARRRDGHLLRLWAEVFHVSSSGSGTVKWQQVSEDLVPVNITCIQDPGVRLPHHRLQLTGGQDSRRATHPASSPPPRGTTPPLSVTSSSPPPFPVTTCPPSPLVPLYFRSPAVLLPPWCPSTSGHQLSSFPSGAPPLPVTKSPPLPGHQLSSFPSGAPLLPVTNSPPLPSPSFKFSRKASSSYNLKLEPVRGGVGGGGGGGKAKGGRRKPVSTPASPSRAREPQCTCMTAEQYARLRAQDPRYRGREAECPGAEGGRCGRPCSVGGTHTGATGLYDNLPGHWASTLPRTQGGRGVVEGTATRPAGHAAAATQAAAAAPTQTGAGDTLAARRGGADTYSTMKVGRDPRQPPSHHASQASLHHKASAPLTRKEEAAAAAAAAASGVAGTGASGGGAAESGGGGGRESRGPGGRAARRELSSKSVDYSEMDTVREGDALRRRARSRSTDDVTKGEDAELALDSSTLKKMLQPMAGGDSPTTSPEQAWPRGAARGGALDQFLRGALGGGSLGGGDPSGGYADGFQSEGEAPRPHRLTPSRSAMSVLGGGGGGGGGAGRGFRLDLGERESPPSDHQLFDLACYATTPSSMFFM